MARHSGDIVARNWNLDLVNAKKAMNYLKRELGEINWSGVEVAQIDTGYTEHPVFGDFSSTTNILWQAGKNYQDEHMNSLPVDPMNYDGLLQSAGHGTEIASVICGHATRGKFDGGACPGLPLIPYRATNSVILGFPASSNRERTNVAKSIRHAIDRNEADIINICLGSAGLSFAFGSRNLGKAVDYAYDNGVIICAAAGQGTDLVTYPGKFFRTIGCGAVNPDRSIWNTKGQGYHEFEMIHIDVWGPGSNINIPTIGFDSNHELITDLYEQKASGTSYATAHVTAAAAMWLARHGTEIDRLYGHQKWMRVEAFRYLLKASAQSLRADQQSHPGTGILDIKALLTAELPSPHLLKYEDRLAVNMYN
ncbi:hypothetical protein MNBD_GAMMA12-3235 [hydrothermal vent metagenome]|uniref:Peptidase S8/S53 domain-containing protein n=1 Tax=hydrothermal vent metagenome TaxID=652676 RepID=A0A3B0YU01_9ZZZZ